MRSFFFYQSQDGKKMGGSIFFNVTEEYDSTFLFLFLSASFTDAIW